MLSSKIIATRYVIIATGYVHGCRCFWETTGDVDTPAFGRIPKLPEMAEAAWSSTRVMMDRENPIEHTNKTHRHDTGGGKACNNSGDVLP